MKLALGQSEHRHTAMLAGIFLLAALFALRIFFSPTAIAIAQALIELGRFFVRGA